MSIREEASFYSDSGQPPASPNPLLEDDFPTSMRSNTNNNNQMDDITEPNSTTAMNVEDPNNTTGNTRSTTNNNNSTNPNQTNNSSRNVFNLISQTFAGYLRGTGATPVATTGNPLTQNGANNQRGSNSGSDRSDSIAVDPRLINDPFIQGPMVITQADGHPSRNIVEWLGFWFQQRYMSHPSPQRDDLLPMNLLSDGLPNGVTEPPSVTTNENDPDLARAIESSINQNQANNNNLKKPRVTTMNPIIAKANIKKESIHATIHKSTTPISSSSSSSSCVKLSFLLDLVTDCTVRLHIDAKDNLPNKILCKKVVDEVKVIGKRQLGYPITMVIPEMLTNNSITNIDTSSAKVETDNTAKKPNIEIKVESESQATDSNCYPIAIEVEYAVSNPSRTSNGSHHKLVIFCKVEHHMTSDNSDESHQISIKPSYTKFVNELGMAFLIQDIYGVSEPRKRKKTGASNGKAPPPMIEDGLLPNAVVISNDTGIRGTMDQTQESVPSSNQNPPILDSSTLANNKIDNVDTSNNGNDNSSSKSSSSTNLANTRDCVICLAEEKNTVVLPCRHMCLCHDCAEVLRNQSSKCPICRQPFHSLLYLVLDDARESMEAPAALAKINSSSIISPF